jgi:hypothetical protein
MERLRSYPDIGREELIRFFTLTRKDLGFVDNLGHGGGRGPAARLGLAVQLCTLPRLGFVPDDIWSVPQAAVLRLANQLEVFPGALTRMSEACGVSYDTLAWTQEWYVREDTLRDANTVIVNHHYGLELARKFGGGTMSSSDGQRFPVRGKSLTGRDMIIHGGRVLSTYTHVSDQWSTYGTKQIVATHREGHLSDPVYRRKITWQLNKGESLHALRRDLHTPSRAPSSAATSKTRPNRPGASPCSRTR